MDETILGKKALKAFIVLFFYLQFLSLVSFVSYWTTVGVDPSGYFSLQDVLVLSVNKIMPIFLMLFFLAVYFFLTKGERREGGEEGGFWKGFFLLAGILFILVTMARKFPLEWDSLFVGVAAFVCYFARFGVSNIIKPLQLDEIFGSRYKAFVYVSIASVGLAMAYPASIYSARSDMAAIKEKALIRLLDDPKKYYLIGKIGDYHVVNRDDQSVMVVPNSRIDKVIYQK